MAERQRHCREAGDDLPVLDCLLDGNQHQVRFTRPRARHLSETAEPNSTQETSQRSCGPGWASQAADITASEVMRISRNLA